MEADRFVRERGGRLYVWLRPLGGLFSRLSVTTKAPRSLRELEVVYGGGFELLLDRELERPDVVDVSLRRWPRRRIRVQGVRVQGMVTDEAGLTPLDHVIWDSAAGGCGDGGGGNGGGGNGGGGG